MAKQLLFDEAARHAMKNGIDALTPDLKAKIPQTLDLSDEQYKERLKKRRLN